MPSKFYTARLKYPDGKEVDVDFVHGNFTGNESQAKAEYENNHPGVQVLTLKEKGDLSLNDERRMFGQIESGQRPTQPTPTPPQPATPTPQPQPQPAPAPAPAPK